MPDFNNLVVELQNKLVSEPKNSQLLNDLAIALMEVNNFEKALECFETAVQNKPSVQSLNNLGFFYYTEGEPVGDGAWRYREDKAIDLLKKAIELNPKSHFPYAILGRIYTLNKDYEKAMPLLHQSAKYKPTLENLNNLGVCYYFTSSIPKAFDFFHAASLKRGDQNRSLYPLLSSGICMSSLGEISEAKNIAEELLVHCNEQDLFFEEDDIADLLYEIGDFKKVVEIYEKSKLGYSRYWVPSYLYSIKQTGNYKKLNDVISNVILKAEEDIKNTLNDDDDDDWSYEDRQEHIEEIRADISFYKKSLEKILKGERPSIDFQPSIENTCYLFGCLRHNNPHYR
ncbi:MAG: tetratricopeptide repeat protein [Paenibacillus sp.]|nr:tetratricopeptide repeat protein [Paenibacillus sp.]